MADNGIKCGKCKGYHPTTDDVKSCYQGTLEPTCRRPEPSDEDLERTAGDLLDEMLKSRKEQKEPMWPASDKQIEYLLALQDERLLPDNWTVYTEADLRQMERDMVSSTITMLVAMPKRNNGDSKGKTQWTMPEGRYALYTPGPDDEPGNYSYVDRQDLVQPSRGKWRFYQVDKPTDGRWEGYTFVKQLVGAPGDFRKQNVPASQRGAILKRIEEDPKTAMINFGKEVGICGRCGSPLTNEESRAMGIGPICAGKDGWF